MRRGASAASDRGGRHRATRPDHVGRALRRALVATLAPALALGIVAGVVVRTASDRLVDLAVDRSALLWVVVGIAVLWSLWIALIWRTYARNRRQPAPRALRVAGAFGVLVMCAAVSAPMAVGARYAVVQRDLIGSVFGDEDSATAPR